MQIELLKEILETNKDILFRDSLANKILKGSFKKYPFDVIVSISDDGVIKRLKKFDTSQVIKADMVTDKIAEIIQGYRKNTTLYF